MKFVLVILVLTGADTSMLKIEGFSSLSSCQKQMIFDFMPDNVTRATIQSYCVHVQ